MIRATLAEIRREGGAAAVRAAIVAALAEHGDATRAAAALGTTPRALRRAGQRLGCWPDDLPPGPPEHRQK